LWIGRLTGFVTLLAGLIAMAARYWPLLDRWTAGQDVAAG